MTLLSLRSEWHISPSSSFDRPQSCAKVYWVPEYSLSYPKIKESKIQESRPKSRCRTKKPSLQPTIAGKEGKGVFNCLLALLTTFVPAAATR